MLTKSGIVIRYTNAVNEENESLPCAGKLAFDTEAAAQATATTLAYQRGAKVRPYKCAHCSLWHLTSMYEA